MSASTACLRERTQSIAGMHAQAADGVKRAQRGGMLTGAMLAAVASLLTGATRMQRNIISAAASSQEGGQISEQSPIWPIYAPIKVQLCSGLRDMFSCCGRQSGRQSIQSTPAGSQSARHHASAQVLALEGLMANPQNTVQM